MLTERQINDIARAVVAEIRKQPTPTKVEERAAWLKKWHDRVDVPHKSFGECRSHHGGDCTCGAEEAMQQLKELFK